jgi:hypothetical protein
MHSTLATSKRNRGAPPSSGRPDHSSTSPPVKKATGQKATGAAIGPYFAVCVFVYGLFAFGASQAGSNG